MMLYIKNLLKHKNILTLPKTRQEEDFPTFIEKMLDEYLGVIEELERELEINTDNKKLIIKQRDVIIKSLHLYYKGQVSKAYLEFEECLNSIIDNLHFMR